MVKLLITGAIIIILSVLCSKFSKRTGIPILLIFIGLGMLFGSDGLLKIEFSNYKFAGEICSAALIFIMFYGGFGTKWSVAKPIAAKAILLSSVGTILTAGLVGVFCHFVLGFGIIEGFLTGAILSSTDAASVFSVLRTKKLNLKYNTASILEVESGSNDPFAYMLTIIFITILKGNFSASGIVKLIFLQIVLAVLIGIAVAFLAGTALKKFDFISDGFNTAFVMAAAVFAYALPELIGSNGYLSTYIVGIILGNMKIPNKKAQVNFFDGITSLVQVGIFFTLGLLAFPSKLPGVLIPSALIALFLTFIARPVAVNLILAPFKSKRSQMAIVSWAGLRGAASIVFAIIATVNGQKFLSNDIFHITFCVVLLSILFQGTLLPFISKKLDMIDKNSNVLKTFNDYSEENEIQFIRLEIKSGSYWINKRVKNISLPPETLLILIQRDENSIVPKGNTKIKENDKVILCAKSCPEDESVKLKERNIDKNHKWCGKYISELELSDKSIIIMVMRNGRTIIPNGRFKISKGDVVVINSLK